ncbi:hypothetical protein MTO96_045818 [Rhipicephalus appendiculatus]
MESRPPPTVPYGYFGYFSAIGDAAFVGTGSRPPQGSAGVTGEQRHQEGLLIAEFAMVVLWVTLSLCTIVLAGGVIITCLAYARRIDFEDRHLGMLMILLAVVVAVFAAALGVVRTCRQRRSLPV